MRTGAGERSIREALGSLPLFDDMFLRLQALNLDVVDQHLQQLEGADLRAAASPQWPGVG